MLSILLAASLALPPHFPHALPFGRRRAVRSVRQTRVRAGYTTTFSGSHGVSGTATIVTPNLIRVTNYRHDGSAPGLDFRIGVMTKSRLDFRVLQITGRQSFNGATIDLMLPPDVDLDSFDTFTVWCYEFTVVIAEGQFRP